jgi:hypothetical protein
VIAIAGSIPGTLPARTCASRARVATYDFGNDSARRSDGRGNVAAETSASARPCASRWSRAEVE